MHAMAEEMRKVAVASRCRHEKVYSGECLELGDGTRWFYVCTGCFETGSDKALQPPEFDPPTYWKMMRKLDPKCWVPAKYR